MNTDIIDALLQKFYDGTSTVEEERIITEYFRSQKEIPERYAIDSKIFLAIDDAKKESRISIPDELEKRLDAHIDLLAKNSQTAIKHWRKWVTIASVAACAALLIIAFTFIYSPNVPQTIPTEPAIAQSSVADTVVKPEPNLAIAITPDIAPKEVKKTVVNKHKRRKMTVSTAKLATTQEKLNSLQEPASPDEAYAAAQKALMKLSNKLDRSAIALDIAESKIELIPEEIETYN